MGGRPGFIAPLTAPTYNFCVVVDDIDMAITHVIRSDDHVNNTHARSISFVHSAIRATGVRPSADRAPAEQAKNEQANGRQPVTQYRDEGFLPDAMIQLPGPPGLEPW